MKSMNYTRTLVSVKKNCYDEKVSINKEIFFQNGAMCTTDQVACESWKFESMASEDSSIVKIKKTNEQKRQNEEKLYKIHTETEVTRYDNVRHKLKKMIAKSEQLHQMAKRENLREIFWLGCSPLSNLSAVSY